MQRTSLLPPATDYKQACRPSWFVNERNEAILRDVNQAGRVWLSNASVRGAAGLPACITKHRTTEQDVRTVVEEVLVAADRVAAHA